MDRWCGSSGAGYPFARLDGFGEIKKSLYTEMEIGWVDLVRQATTCLVWVLAQLMKTIKENFIQCGQADNVKMGPKYLILLLAPIP